MISRNGLIILLVIAGIELYVWQGFKTILADSSKGLRIGVSVAYLLFALITLVCFYLAGRYGNVIFTSSIFNVFFTASIILLFGKLFFALFLVLDDIIRLWRWLLTIITSSGDGGNSISRLKFLSQVGAVVGSLPIATLTYGIVKGAHHYQVKEVDLKLNNLPSSFVGKKLVQLSDIHAGSFWDKTAVKKGVKQIIDIQPDMVFFTGDLVNNKAEELKEYSPIFGEIKAPLGVYSVLGNHDYGDYVAWNTEEEKAQNLQTLMSIQKDMGWDLLMNEHRKIEVNGEKIVVAGIENYGAKGRFPKYGKMPDAMNGVDPNDPILLLSHDPSHWRAQVLKDYPMVDAMFSGHTHGAQFGIETAGFKWSPVKYMYKEWAGLYAEKGQQLYVNRGFGYLGYPGRFGIRPEITVFTLTKA